MHQLLDAHLSADCAVIAGVTAANWLCAVHHLLQDVAKQLQSLKCMLFLS